MQRTHWILNAQNDVVSFFIPIVGIYVTQTRVCELDTAYGCMSKGWVHTSSLKIEDSWICIQIGYGCRETQKLLYLEKIYSKFYMLKIF